jgi:AcrR family transcriptional regulator
MSSPAPSKPQRDAILRTAAALFDRHGIRATGVDRIIAESGVAKATLYRHFPSKDDLVLAVLAQRGPAQRDSLTQAALAHSQTTGEPAALAVFDALAAWFLQPDFNGCPFAKAAQELPENQAVVAAALAHKRTLQDWLRDQLVQTSHQDPGATAAMMILLMDGATVHATLRADGAPAQAAKAAATAILAASPTIPLGQ